MLCLAVAAHQVIRQRLLDEPALFFKAQRQRNRKLRQRRPAELLRESGDGGSDC